MSSIHRTLSEPGMGTSVPAILRAAGVVVAMAAAPAAAAAAAAAGGVGMGAGVGR